MLDAILQFSLRQRGFVIFITLAFAGLGVYNFQRLPIDAVPDITNVQVQVNIEAPGYTPLEVEQRITFPLENALSGIPRLSHTRSISRYGLSQVTAIFEDETDVYFARQLVFVRLQTVRGQLPDNIEPVMGPISTGLGEIFMWTVEAGKDRRKPDGSPYSLTDLRTLQDWIIRPQLRTVPGVAEVNSLGGYVKQFHVTPYPEKLIAFGLSFADIVSALVKNNSNTGAGYIEHSGEQYLIRAPGQAGSLADLRQIVVGAHKGVPIHIHDVAEVSQGSELRTGAATQNGSETVLGTVFMLIGENSRTVSLRVEEKLRDINKTLPEGVTAQPVYNRTRLVDATLATVRNNLAEGAVLVIAVLFLLLGNFRAAVITALVIPLSMLFAVTGMVSHRVSGNLLSLGAIDFGIIIDGAVIIVENCIRRLSEAETGHGRPLTPPERLGIVQRATREVLRPSIFGVGIIMIVYVPILTLTGIEGKMFRPMAFTVLAALTGALLLSILFVPAMITLFAGRKHVERENFFQVRARKYHAPALRWVLRHRVAVVVSATVLFVSSLVLGSTLGSEFLPELDEGDLAVHALRIPGTSLTQAISMQHQVERKVAEFPEVDRVFSKIGTADIASDPMPPSVADVFIMLHPRQDWPDPTRDKKNFIRNLEAELSQLPGNKYEFLQPIQMRFNELISGVRSDVAVKIFGEDLDMLVSRGKETAQILASIPGAADVQIEQVTGLPVFSVQLNREVMARLGLNVADVQEVIEIAIGGKKAGLIFEGDQRSDVIVRLPESIRTDLESIQKLPLPFPIHERTDHDLFSRFAPERGNPPGPGRIFLNAVADFPIVQGPNQISRENGKRRIVVTANVRDRDLGSFVREAQSVLGQRLQLPPGYWLSWGGEFEHFLSASRRLWIVVPIALVSIFFLLFTAFQSIKNALLVLTGIPLALTGGIVSLWVRGIPFSISAAVGFIALSGVAVLNGIVMISFIQKLREEGVPLEQAIFEGCLARLRPVLMTALVAALGFIPMALSTGTGAEVQRPLATVVIGGILSSTALTLLVLPALYQITHQWKGKPLRKIKSESAAG